MPTAPGTVQALGLRSGIGSPGEPSGRFTAQRELSVRILGAQRQELSRLQNEHGVAHAVVQEFELEFDLAEIALSRFEGKDQKFA